MCLENSLGVKAHGGSNPSASAKKREASSIEGASCFLREYKWDSNAVNKTTL